MNNVLISPRTDPKKRGAVSQVRSKQASTPNSARRILSVSPSKCVLCEKKAFKPKDYNQFASMVNKSLYVKYASSQNYYYTKDINEMLADSHTPAVIKFKDYQCYDEEDEYLKRFYKEAEYNNKIQLLTEYYKFHWDIPRLFMMPTTEVLNRFHDKKRRLQYVRVTKMLKEQKESKNPQGKADEANKPKAEEPKLPPITDRVLVDLETSYSILKTEDIKGYSKKGKQPEEKKKPSSKKTLEDEERKKDSRRSNTREYSGINKARDGTNTQRKIQKKKEAEQQSKGKEASISNTLHDLNMKLGEIIASNTETTHLFDRTDHSINQSMSNLKSFLNYLQTKPTSTIEPVVVKETPKSSKSLKNTTQDQPPSRPDSGRKSLSRKPSTPRLEKPEKQEEAGHQDPAKRPSIITWNRTDSVPLVRPSPNLTRRESKITNEGSKVEERPKELEPAVLGPARILSAQSSLSSTSTSKSKSVYPSVTRIRNFEEAVKIGQQSSFQPKLMTPTETPVSSKLTSSLPASTTNIAHKVTKESGEAAPTQAHARNVDLSIKIPQILLEERLKDFNLQISPSGSQIYSPKTATAKSSTSKMVKSTMPLTSRGSEAMKNLDNLSPLHSPQFRIKSHRESGSSFDKGNNKESSQGTSTTSKQVPLIQMTLSKNGHARFASGGMVPQSNRASHARNSGSPTFPIQTGREAKGLMPFGTLDMKDIRILPSSASRREVMLGKGGDLKVEAVTGTAFKASEGVGIMTDREKELTPLTPKTTAATHRDKLISHKHTRSEGGRLKSDQLEALMGTINDQKIRELLRLNEGGATGLSDLINKSRKNGEAAAMKNMGSYNMSNIVMSSHRDTNYDSAPISSSVYQRKQSQPKMSGEGVITPRNVKMELGHSKSKSQLKRTDSVGSETKIKSSGGVDKADLRDEYKPGKTKTKFFG